MVSCKDRGSFSFFFNKELQFLWILILFNEIYLLLSLLVLKLKLCWIWPVGAPSIWFLCLLTSPYHSLLSCTRCCRITLFFLRTSSRISSFLQQALVLFSGEQYLETNISVLSVFSITSVSLFLGHSYGRYM